MFSRREPVENDDGENERDVFNEKPSAEEVRSLFQSTVVSIK